MISITSAPEAPPPRIRIVDSRGREVETVRIGDKLTFRIEIPDDSKYSFGISGSHCSDCETYDHWKWTDFLYWNPWQIVSYFSQCKA
jgi:hypothetical protein